MYNLGFDVSINSTAVCIETEDGYEFFSFFEGFKDSYYKSTAKAFQHLQDVNDFHIRPITRTWKSLSKQDKKNYSLSEATKLEDVINNTQFIIESLRSYLKNCGYIGMEGFSYGSSGSSLIDIVGFTYRLRSELNYFGDMVFVSPSHVKKYAGHNIEEKTGNANKVEMFELFLESKDEKLRSTTLWKKVKSNPNNFTKELKSGLKILTPLDDLIDSYFVLKSSSLVSTF